MNYTYKKKMYDRHRGYAPFIYGITRACHKARGNYIVFIFEYTVYGMRKKNLILTWEQGGGWKKKWLEKRENGGVKTLPYP